MKTDGLVTSRSEIEANLETMQRYRIGSADEREFHRGRIKNGKNFVARRAKDHWQFAPSKFAGYSGNDTSHMARLDDRDGGVTNNRITDLLGAPLAPKDRGYDEVDAAYVEYATAHDIVPSRHPRGRKYWVL